MLALNISETGQEQIRSESVGSNNAHMARQGWAPRQAIFLRCKHSRFHHLGMDQQLGPGICQCPAVGGAIEQAILHRSLKASDVAADRGVVDLQVLGSLGEPATTCDFQKEFEIISREQWFTLVNYDVSQPGPNYVETAMGREKLTEGP